MVKTSISGTRIIGRLCAGTNSNTFSFNSLCQTMHLIRHMDNVYFHWKLYMTLLSIVLSLQVIRMGFSCPTPPLTKVCNYIHLFEWKKVRWRGLFFTKLCFCSLIWGFFLILVHANFALLIASRFVNIQWWSLYGLSLLLYLNKECGFFSAISRTVPVGLCTNIF